MLRAARIASLRNAAARQADPGHANALSHRLVSGPGALSMYEELFLSVTLISIKSVWHVPLGRALVHDKGGFYRNLWNGIAIHKSIEYIEANPVRRKRAAIPSEYGWSSAYARERESGLIPDRFNMPVALLNSKIQRIGAM